MKNFLFSAISGLTLALASTAAQATVAIDLGNTSGQAQANALDGTDGNARTYSGVDGGNAFNVRITGWSSSSTSNVISNAFLGAFSGAGLGVTNQGESGLGNHTVDNSGYYDFVLLQFDRNVVLDWANFNSIDNGDTDATIGRGITLASWASSPAWNGASTSVLASTFASIYGTVGGTSDNKKV